MGTSILIDTVGQGVEYTGVVTMVVGMTVAMFRWVGSSASEGTLESRIPELRRRLGWAILLGLEFLVAGDILRTVAIEPSLASIAVLAGIVLIRTFLSFTLTLEIEGRWPWQRRTSPDS